LKYLKILVFLLILIQLTQSAFHIESIADSFSSSPETNNRFDFSFVWLFDINKNGCAVVAGNITCLVPTAFNISVPKTAKLLSCQGDFEKIDYFATPFSVDYLEVTPVMKKNVTSAFVKYIWPDFAVAFNGTYYVSSSERVEICSVESMALCNVTLIFPEFSKIIYGYDQERMTKKSFENRTYISYSEEVLYRKEYLDFMFVQPFYEEKIEEKVGDNITISCDNELANWTSSSLDYCERAYSKLESFLGTRQGEKRPLKIHFVPYLYIENRCQWCLAFYWPPEDAIYFPAHYIFSLSYGGYELHYMFHEIGHAFIPRPSAIPDSTLPRFFEEGLAEYLSLCLLDSLGMHEYAERKVQQGCKDPLIDPYFNSSHFFEWENRSFAYSHAFYVVFGLVNYTSPLMIRNLLTVLKQDEVNFYQIKDQSARYDALIFYLNIASQKDTSKFFEKYGLSTNPNRILLIFIVDVTLFVLICCILIIIIRNWISGKLDKKQLIFSVLLVGWGIFSLEGLVFQISKRWLLFSNEFSSFSIVVALPFLLVSFLWIRFFRAGRARTERQDGHHSVHYCPTIHNQTGQYPIRLNKPIFSPYSRGSQNVHESFRHPVGGL